MVSGRKPDVERRQTATRLRKEGLTLKQIGLHLGVSPQAVHQLLQGATALRLRGVACAGCNAWIDSEGALPRDTGLALCANCLAHRPDAPFGQRLRALRLARGWTVAELARRSGLSWEGLRVIEDGECRPHATTVAILAKVLGKELLPPVPAPVARQLDSRPK